MAGHKGIYKTQFLGLLGAARAVRYGEWHCTWGLAMRIPIKRNANGDGCGIKSQQREAFKKNVRLEKMGGKGAEETAVQQQWC